MKLPQVKKDTINASLKIFQANSARYKTGIPLPISIVK